jgi:hypothetical protein
VGQDTEVLDLLLPPGEAQWFATFRSRPLVLLGACRRVLHAQYRAGTLDRVVYRKLDEVRIYHPWARTTSGPSPRLWAVMTWQDLKELDLVIGGCERLFSSPAPPTMARHAVRSMFLWLLGLPLVLAGSMAPAACAMWVFFVAYASSSRLSSSHLSSSHLSSSHLFSSPNDRFAPPHSSSYISHLRARCGSSSSRASSLHTTTMRT